MSYDWWLIPQHLCSMTMDQARFRRNTITFPMGCYLSPGCLLLVLWIVHSMFGTSSCCFMEERAALMDVSSSLTSAQSEVPRSWGHGDDCCSWEGITCNNATGRVSHLHLSSIYRQINTNNKDGSQSVSGMEPGFCWSMSLAIFSSFHELELLDLSRNYACFQNFDGLQGLKRLQFLNLSDNSLAGSFPPSVSKLVSLEVINLAGNNITGTLQNTGLKSLWNMRELHLRSNQMSGSLPASIFALPRLEYLDLSDNLFEGDIPISSSWNCSSPLHALQLSGNKLIGKFDLFWLRKCTKLKVIDLSGNTDLVVHVKFHDSVPQFELKALLLSWCKLDKNIIKDANFLRTQRHLEFLDLSNNNLPGSMPNWLFMSAEALYHLDLSNNSLVGSLDPIRGHQYNLQLLNISLNHFIGQLPTNIGALFPNLTILDASHNTISGVVPSSLCNIVSLELLALSSNNFTGPVPTCLFTNCSALKILKLSSNSLGGMILSGASNLSFLWEVYLDNNKFEGTLPRNLSGSVQIMDLHGNNMSGELDTSSWNLSLLEALSLASNSLTGRIPAEICQLTSVELLDLSDNYFDGPMPNCSITLNLQFLNMSGNSLSGAPEAFYSSSYITALDLSCNHFTGNIEWTQNLSQISLLLLGGNKFVGKLSSNLCHLLYLSVIDVSCNRLSGSIPPCIGEIPFRELEDYSYLWPRTDGSFFGNESPDMDLDGSSFMYNSYYDLPGFTFTTKGNPRTYGRSFFLSMSGIDLSSNFLSGEIPQGIGNLSHLKSLNLSNNLFTGQIPATLGNMREIESLDLSENMLDGLIPWQLTGLSSLETFSVAYNNLSGCVPDAGQFSTFDMDSYKGNINLRSCNSSSHPVAPSSPMEETTDDSDPILYVVSALSFVLTFWATVAFIFCHSFGQRVILKLQ